MVYVSYLLITHTTQSSSPLPFIYNNNNNNSRIKKFSILSYILLTAARHVNQKGQIEKSGFLFSVCAFSNPEIEIGSLLGSLSLVHGGGTLRSYRLSAGQRRTGNNEHHIRGICIHT